MIQKFLIFCCMENALFYFLLLFRNDSRFAENAQKKFVADRVEFLDRKIGAYEKVRHHTGATSNDKLGKYGDKCFQLDDCAGNILYALRNDGGDACCENNTESGRHDVSPVKCVQLLLEEEEKEPHIYDT